MKIDTSPRHKNAPRPANKSAPGYLQWLRGRNCACQGRNLGCSGKIQAAHVDYAGRGTDDAKGIATKVADKWAIPLSASCHRVQHNNGWPWFDIELLGYAGAGERMAMAYWAKWPGRVAWETKNG